MWTREQDRQWTLAWWLIWRRRRLRAQRAEQATNRGVDVAPVDTPAPLFVINTSGLDWLCAEFDRLDAEATAALQAEKAPPRRDPRTGRRLR